MSDGRKEANPKRPLGGELIIPIAAALFAIYYLSTVRELAWQANAVGIAIAGAMAVALAILGVRFTREWARGEADFSLGELAHPLDALGRRLALLAASAGFIALMPSLGFTLSVFVFLIAGVIILSGLSQLKWGVPIALAISLGGYLLFVVFVGARFPAGPVEALLRSLI